MRFKPYSSEANYELGRTVLTFELPTMYNKDVAELFSKPSKNGYELKASTEKRSLNANAYLWVLCDKIAQVIHSTKEDVYRTAVKQVGVYEQLSFTDANALKRFAENWQANGLGWIVEVVDDELMIVNAYYGSSRYHTDEMSVLIENVIDAAKELDIEVKQQEEINSLLREWEHG